MAQNVQHWLLDRDRFPWARERVSERKWVQVRKYFPGEKLRRQMLYVDADTGTVIAVEGGEEVPAGKVYLYGYDLRTFCGIDVPGLDKAMSATPKSRLQQRSAPGGAGAPARVEGARGPHQGRASAASDPGRGGEQRATPEGVDTGARPAPAGATAEGPASPETGERAGS
jgi:hypothetical protein